MEKFGRNLASINYRVEFANKLYKFILKWKIVVSIRLKSEASNLPFYFSLLILQEIYKDRKKFSKAVFEVASSDLVNMGISVVSYTLKDIKDDEVC